jgi:hypothetical protein
MWPIRSKSSEDNGILIIRPATYGKKYGLMRFKTQTIGISDAQHSWARTFLGFRTAAFAFWVEPFALALLRSLLSLKFRAFLPSHSWLFCAHTFTRLVSFEAPGFL